MNKSTNAAGEQPETYPTGYENDEDEADSLAGTNTTGGSDPNKRMIPKKEDEVSIAKEENKSVFRLKLLVIIVLLASTVGVAVVVYLYVNGAEQASFEAHFDDDSDKVSNSAQVESSACSFCSLKHNCTVGP